ncbi:unnamed protein product, partial [marine sediment metagenome]
MTDFGRRVEAAAAANVLPKTGETIDEPVGCDGYYQAGWEGDRFTDNGDGTITDNATSLMWPKDAADAGLDMQTRAWADQIAHIEGLTFAGHSDWRMCNIVELQSILDWIQDHPDINSIIQNAQQKYPYVSTTAHGDTDKAWYWNYDYP